MIEPTEMPRIELRLERLLEASVYDFHQVWEANYPNFVYGVEVRFGAQPTSGHPLATVMQLNYIAAKGVHHGCQ